MHLVSRFSMLVFWFLLMDHQYEHAYIVWSHAYRTRQGQDEHGCDKKDSSCSTTSCVWPKHRPMLAKECMLREAFQLKRDFCQPTRDPWTTDLKPHISHFRPHLSHLIPHSLDSYLAVYSLFQTGWSCFPDWLECLSGWLAFLPGWPEFLLG